MESSFDKIRKNFFATVIPLVVKGVLIFALIGIFLYIASQYEQLFDGSSF